VTAVDAMADRSSDTERGILRGALLIAVVITDLACAVSARADIIGDAVAAPSKQAFPSPWLDLATSIPLGEARIAGFRTRGNTKVTDRTLGYLAHVRIGDPISSADLPRLETALISSELFKTAVITLEDSPDGVIVVATLEDKWSWIAAPTLYLTNPNRAVGVGFVENDVGGRDQKLLLYAQYGTQSSILFATFLDPAYHGTKLTYRFDLYLENRYIDEYENPLSDPTNQDIERSTREVFLDAGALVGWNFEWWLVGDLRLRGAYVYFRDAYNPTVDPDHTMTLPQPEKDGRDVTVQARLTLDHRFNYFGVTHGAYLQVMLEQSVPELDSYGYGDALVRAYYSWVLWGEHELELRSLNSIGYHLPMQEELALGGVSDLRGYPTDEFRGDVNLVVRAEYSVPLFKWTPKPWLPTAFRALGFYDGGFDRFLFPRDPSERLYLPGQLDRSFLRDDVGIGFRVYLKSIVLPLVGFDVAYGIEAKTPQFVLELGLTDF
jgi:outer membrane protein insertion porin family